LAILTLPSLSWAQKGAVAWLGLLVLVAAVAPALPLPYSPNVPDLSHIAQAPLGPARHWLGTDTQGCDVLSALVFGTRTAVLLTMPAAVLAASMGALLGGAAGFWGNRTRVDAAYWAVALGGIWWALGLPAPWLGPLLSLAGAARLLMRTQKRHTAAFRLPLDALVMGAATALDTVPRLVLVVALAASAGSLSTTGLLALLAFTAWPTPARLVRAQMLRVRALPFIEAAQAAGLPTWRIWLWHAMSHAINPLQAALPLSLARLLGLESTLSFLGIGLPPDAASWGRLMASFRQEPMAWWLFIFPTTLLTVSILSLYILSGRRRA
jgi:peptide/nickel transport system permease protein